MGAVTPEIAEYVQQAILECEERVVAAIALVAKMRKMPPGMSLELGECVSVNEDGSADVLLDMDGQVATALVLNSIMAGVRVGVLIVPPAGAVVLGQIGLPSGS
jgi:hypothetical protein